MNTPMTPEEAFKFIEPLLDASGVKKTGISSLTLSISPAELPTMVVTYYVSQVPEEFSLDKMVEEAEQRIALTVDMATHHARAALRLSHDKEANRLLDCIEVHNKVKEDHSTYQHFERLSSWNRVTDALTSTKGL